MKFSLKITLLIAPMTFGSWELFANSGVREFPAMSVLQNINHQEKLNDYKLDQFKSKQITWDAGIEPEFVMSWMHSELDRETILKIRSNPQYIQQIKLNEAEGAQAR